MQYHIISDETILEGTFNLSFTASEYQAFRKDDKGKELDAIFKIIAQNINKIPDEEIIQKINSEVFHKQEQSLGSNYYIKTITYERSIESKMIITDSNSDKFSMEFTEVSTIEEGAKVLSNDEASIFGMVFSSNEGTVYIIDNEDDIIGKMHYEMTSNFHKEDLEQLFETIFDKGNQHTSIIDSHTYLSHVEFDYVI